MPSLKPSSYDRLNNCYRYAVATRDIGYNPVDGVQLPKQENMSIQTKEIEILPDADVELLEATQSMCYKTGWPRYWYAPAYALILNTGLRSGDDDDKIRLNQRKPSKYKGLSRFGPEKNLQRINKFMKERPIFYKNLIQMKENFRFYLRCFYCITKVVILQFNSENRTELARNG